MNDGATRRGQLTHEELGDEGDGRWRRRDAEEELRARLSSPSSLISSTPCSPRMLRRSSELGWRRPPPSRARPALIFFCTATANGTQRHGHRFCTSGARSRWRRRGEISFEQALEATATSITILDFWSRNVVWSWTDAGTPASLEDKHAVHAVAMEDGRAVCVVNQYDDLGFLDLRSSNNGVRWRSRSKLATSSCRTKKKAPRQSEEEETCYPKLATHGGRLFASMSDGGGVSVFCGPDHALTSTLRASGGGAICNFSIGGGPPPPDPELRYAW